MRIDTNIVLALDAFAEKNHFSKVKLAEYLGVSGATITKWHRVGSGIVNSRWETQLFPLLRDFLPKERLYIDDAGRECYSSTNEKSSKYFFEPKYVPVEVPIFSLETVSGYDDTLDSIMQYAKSKKAEYVEFRPKTAQRVSSVFAVSTTDSRLANFPFSSMTLFVSAGDRPRDNGLVVVRPVNGKAFVGVYNREVQNFTISEVCGSQKISGAIADAKKLLSWVFPVLYAESVTF